MRRRAAAPGQNDLFDLKLQLPLERAFLKLALRLKTGVAGERQVYLFLGREQWVPADVPQVQRLGGLGQVL